MKALTICLVINLFSHHLFAQKSDFEGVDFSKADSISALYQDHSLINLKVLSDKLTQPLTTDVEKFRAIYFWVSTNISNDYETYLRNKYKRLKYKDQPKKLQVWNSKASSILFDRLLNQKETFCTGYAYLIRELAYHAGLKSQIINGFGRTKDFNTSESTIPNHSWNAIQINGKWYLCDATWSSGRIDLNQKEFVKDFNDTYFLTDPQLFAQNHYASDRKWSLTEGNKSIEEFLNAPFIYKEGIKHGLLPSHPERYEVNVATGQLFTVSFYLKDPNIASGIWFKSNKLKVKPAILHKGSNLYQIIYKFKRKGKYNFHLMSGENKLISYLIKVKKK